MKRTCKHGIDRKCGFTMIEMVVVLIIMSIIASFIVVRASTSGNELIAQTEILKSHLRYAQIRAMNDEKPWGIYIPSGGASYILYYDNAQATSAKSLLPGESAQTHTFPSAVTVTSGAGSTYNFNSFGTPVDTGTTPNAVATQTITLSQGTETSNITITKNTGYIP
jgi:prepilin-type N-terminal cleavage/methylation domain-containing protein